MSFPPNDRQGQIYGIKDESYPLNTTDIIAASDAQPRPAARVTLLTHSLTRPAPYSSIIHAHSDNNSDTTPLLH